MLGNNSQLGNRQARNDWEVTFNDAYIRPVTETLDQSIHTAFETVTNDNDQGNSILACLLSYYSLNNYFQSMTNYSTSYMKEWKCQKVELSHTCGPFNRKSHLRISLKKFKRRV